MHLSWNGWQVIQATTGQVGWHATRYRPNENLFNWNTYVERRADQFATWISGWPLLHDVFWIFNQASDLERDVMFYVGRKTLRWLQMLTGGRPIYRPLII